MSTKVKPGQIWLDLNSRIVIGRHIRIDRIEGLYAYCTSYREEQHYRRSIPKGLLRSQFKYKVRIALSRLKFNPGTGMYDLIEEAP